MTTAIAKPGEHIPQGNSGTALAANIRPGRPLITPESLVAEGQQRQLLMKYVEAHMRDGSDYGVIPGTGDKAKKTLLKPGAEKLIDLFRCVPEFEIVERTEDWDRPLFHYLFKCRIRTLEGNVVVAEGVGECNSRESKYRYRNGERKCPVCGKPSIIKGKAEYGGGFVCFAKKGGCGAKFSDGDAAIEGQIVGKVENPDVADSINTILKMAKKRALVDAAIALVRCSDLFTQDAEDFASDAPSDDAPRQSAPQRQQAQPTRQQPPAATDPFEPTEAEIKAAAADGDSFQACVRECGVPWDIIIGQLNGEKGTDYSNTEPIDNPQHVRWIVRNALYETKRKAAQKKSV
jgi:hypothetical protein